MLALRAGVLGKGVGGGERQRKVTLCGVAGMGEKMENQVTPSSVKP